MKRIYITFPLTYRVPGEEVPWAAGRKPASLTGSLAGGGTVLTGGTETPGSTDPEGRRKRASG